METSLVDDMASSVPLEIVGIENNQLSLKLSDRYEFKVPLAILPDESGIPKKLLLKLKKPQESVFADSLLEERHKRLEDLIN